MKPRCLLSTVDRLPTISEMQESESPGDAMEDYADSIRELPQPTQHCYPLHGPLRGHCSWITRATPSLLPHCPGTCAARSPVELSDVSLTVTERSWRHLSQNVLDRLISQTVFAGLV